MNSQRWTCHSPPDTRHRGNGRPIITAVYLLVAIGLCWHPPAFSKDPQYGEGFSNSRRGLPDGATDAWKATVMIVQLEDGASETAGSQQRSLKWGSGLIVDTLEQATPGKGRRVVVATASHVVLCDQAPCRYGVGFTSPNGNSARFWTDEVELSEISTGNDLAFLIVESPVKPPISMPVFADPEHDDSAARRVFAVGWPNLKLRTNWGVPEPKNNDLILKRFSNGIRVQSIDAYPLNNLATQKRERVSVIFHNADLMPGSSGGPLMDEHGHVLGLNSRVFAPEPRSERFTYCCARAESHRPGVDCIHMAISAREIVQEFHEKFGKNLAFISGDDNQQEAHEVMTASSGDLRQVPASSSSKVKR